MTSYYYEELKTQLYSDNCKPLYKMIKAIQEEFNEVIKVYNQYRYEREKQLALESWERKLNSIITQKESNVVTIRKGCKKLV